MLNKQQYARLVNDHRASLIKLVSRLKEGSAVSKSKDITDNAIRCGYVQKRTSPPGSVMSEWVLEKSAPQWACRSAFDILIELGWVPKTDTEKAVCARYVVMNNHPLDDWEEILGHWLTLAKNISTSKNE